MHQTSSTIGDGTRILHFLVDTIIVFLLAYELHGWYNFYVMYWNFTPISFGPFFFAIMWVYLFLFELIFQRTPAKWITGTKVVNKKGGRPSIFQMMLRTSIHCTIVSMLGLAWNGQPFHDSFSNTTLMNTSSSLD